MPIAERLLDIGTRRGRMLSRRFGEDIRRARHSANFSQRQLGVLIGLSHAAVGRVERAERFVDLLTAARLSAVLGMELSLGCHPVSSPARDRGHLALLERLRTELHPSLVWDTEVGLRIPGDLRAMDALIRGADFRAMVEAETHVHDVQATERKMRLKQRDAGLPRAMLLLLGTRHHRELVAASPGLRRSFPLTSRQVLAALRAGRDPGADGIVFL
ncbi:MAG: helix-turn-helix domain-containing protein [Chloroflexota bacterium]|nr:helix-turn-helix domain-containing protein [Chloroflexota bacterium]